MSQREATFNTILMALRFLDANRQTALDAAGDLPDDAALLDAEATQALIADLESGADPCVQAVTSGGLFRSASSDHPLAALMSVEVLDFDLEGNVPEAVAVPQGEIAGWERPEGVLVRSEPVLRGLQYLLEDVAPA